MADQYPVFKMSRTGGDVTMYAGIPAQPQALAANLWQYRADKTFERKVGEFEIGTSALDLGAPLELTGRWFLLDGAVLSMGDSLSGNYTVLLQVTQGQVILYQGKPSLGGSGMISDSDVPVSFRFGLA